MNTAHLAGLDLNLLVVLHVLLATRSTTAAARRLGRTQSAVSHALARLRRALEDPLFVRAGGSLAPTAFASSLDEPVAAILEASEGIFRGPPRAFEALRLARSFSIRATDLFGVAVLPRLVERLRKVAPRVDVDVRSGGDTPVEDQLERGDVDVAFGARFRGGKLSVVDLGSEDMVVVLRKGHAAARRRLTLDAYCRLDHVVVAPRGEPGSAIDSALAPLGRTRRVALRVPHFAAAVLVASSSDLLTTLPRSFARALRGIASYAERELPMASPRFTFQTAIARSREREPDLAWFAAQVADVCRMALGTEKA